MDHRPKYLRAKPIKLLEGNLVNFHGFRLGINMTPREKLDKLDFTKIKNSFTLNDSMKKVKTQIAKWEKIFASYTSDMGLVCKIRK